MSPGLRQRVLLLAALLFTLWATWQVSQDAPAAKTVTARTPVAQRGPGKPLAVAPTLPLVWPLRPQAQPLIADLFGLAPPPPSVLPTAIAPGPAAPVFTLRYVGRLDGSDNRHVFLADEKDQMVVAQVGQPVDADWQLSAMDAQQLVFRHIATGQQHTLQIGPLQ